MAEKNQIDSRKYFIFKIRDLVHNSFHTREFDTFPNEKQRISRMNAYIFLSNLLFLYIGFFGFLCYNGIEVKKIEGQYIKIKKR